MELLYKDLTYEIRKAIFYVHNHIGFGFDEETYHQGLASHFSEIGLPFESKKREVLSYRNRHIATLRVRFSRI